MRLASQAFKTSKGKNLLKLVVKRVGQEAEDIFTYDDLTSFSYSANGTAANSMQFGYAAICSVTFSIFNSDGSWDAASFAGADVSLFLGKELSAGDEYVKIGIFKVDKSPKKASVISITASDRMALFDVRFKGISFPCTIRDLIGRCCSQVGVNFVTAAATNLDAVVDTLENLTAITCREVLSYACELLGCFAIINSDGDLELRWFDTSRTDTEIDEVSIMEFSPDDRLTPSGLSMFFNGEEILFGEFDTALHITDDNVLTRNMILEEVNDLVERVYNNNVFPLSYDVGSLIASGDCLLEPGDVVTFSSKGKRYRFIVAAFKLTGNLKMSIESTAPSSSSSASSGTISPGSASSGDGGLKTAYAFSYEDVVLPVLSPFEELSKEIVSLPLLKSGNHVPVAMFTSTFDCIDDLSLTQGVDFELSVGSQILHVASIKCHKGKNTFTFSWPLEGIPEGQTIVKVIAKPTSGAEGIFPPTVHWYRGDSSLYILGRGFSISSNVWNGLIMASDNIAAMPIERTPTCPVIITKVRDVLQTSLLSPTLKPVTEQIHVFEIRASETNNIIFEDVKREDVTIK